MHHTTNCLKHGKSDDCPACNEIHKLIKEEKIKKEINRIMFDLIEKE